ncbi:MAG TPA: GspMb/PilO family protein [Chthoniobacterales bacterium]|nr:GspMb/PilO family protein [Chthoniobacterales bacterium]
MKPAFQTVALLGLLIILLLGGEAFLLVRGWSITEKLRATNQTQIQANARLEAEIDGLRASQAKINALFTRLNESIARKTNPELNSTNRSLLANRETADQESSVISRMSEVGVVTQPSRVPNGEAANIYLAGSSNLEFSRVVSLIAELENSNPFLYFDKVALSRPSSVPAFSTAPTYLDCRFTVRLLNRR